jgi:penicillin-insensitive murein DD-endopeptidase
VQRRASRKLAVALVLAAGLVSVGALAPSGELAMRRRASAWAEVTDVSALYWGIVVEPLPVARARIVGGFAAACIFGAERLPPEGRGYQALRVSRNRHYGHPSLVSFVVDLGARADDAGLGTVLVGDMAQPRGGPMAGHVSHQSGLDVDLPFRLERAPLSGEARESIEPTSFVDPETGRVDPALWTERQAALVRLAASDPRVSRVFVDAAVKRDLCERSWDDRSWLRRVRTWPRHADHLHVRLSCPPDSPGCRDQEPLPPGEACGAVTQPPVTRVRRTPRTVLPLACRALLEP